MFKNKVTVLWLFFYCLVGVSSVIVFQNPRSFGSMQVQLSTSSGFISQATAKTFSIANPGYSNISTMGLALCGYDMPNPSVIEIKAQVSYNSEENVFLLVLLPLSSTRFLYINYFILISGAQSQHFIYIDNPCLIPPFDPFNTTNLNRVQIYNLTSPYGNNPSQIYQARPFIRSFMTTVAETFVHLNLSSAVINPSSGMYLVSLQTKTSFVVQVCLSVIWYVQSIGMRQNTLNISFSNNFLPIDSETPAISLLAVSQNNFTITNIYGPSFNRKCVVGLQRMRIRATTRQTVSFNFTGDGVFGLSSSRDYLLNYAWFCVAEITCTSADQQYYPTINNCQAKCSVTNCSICSTSTSCALCDPGFFVNTLYRCEPCNSNCISCNTSANCMRCQDGYYTNGLVCLVCPIFCTSCNNQGICLTCQRGYFPNVTQCLRCSSLLPNCDECNVATNCRVCAPGFYFVGPGTGCSSCAAVLSGCESCTTRNICDRCMLGYYRLFSGCRNCTFDIESCCPLFVANCNQCKNTTHCNICQPGFYLTNSGTLCVTCGSQLTNCTVCTDSNTCFLCQVGFFLTPLNTCQACSLYLNQCQRCTNATVCLECASPFVLVQGTCLNCPIWPTRQLYFLDNNNVCQPCSAVTPNCIRCSSSEDCLLCDNLHYLKDGVCLDCSQAINNCLSCKNATSCSICQNGFFINVRNSTQCLLCSSRINNCISCVETLNQLTKLSSMFCTICDAAYYVNNQVCVRCLDSIPYCLECLNSRQCRTCQSSYFLSSTLTCITCQQLIPGCLNCLTASTCASCSNGYYLANNYCTACSNVIANCHSCAPLNNTLTCSSCTQNHYLGVNFTCVPCNQSLPFCSNCQSPSICRGCISGYTLNFLQRCVPCPSVVPFCAHCGQRCLKCMDDYLLSDNGDCLSCSNFITGCQICNMVTYIPPNPQLTPQVSASNVTALNCSVCMPGFLIYLSSQGLGQCIGCNVTLPNCLTCLDVNTCQQCAPISFLNPNKKCSLCSQFLPNCRECSDSSTCQLCSTGFYLNASSLCQQCRLQQFGQDSGPMRLNICLNCVYEGTIAVCLKCIIGYYPAANTCRSCARAMSNCKQCASPQTCLQCASGFYLSQSNNECIQCDPSLSNCATCDASGVCLQCEPDYYLNATLNRCVKCSLFTLGCYSCNSNATCTQCQDGYYPSGVACLSCADAMSNCVLCSGPSNCLLSSAATTQPTTSFLNSLSASIWMIIALGLFGVIALIGLICLLCCCCRKQEPKKQEQNTTVKAGTQRQLLPDHTGLEKPQVQIKQDRHCQVCKQKKFDVMKVELLCKKCEAIQQRGDQHKIRKVMSQEKGKVHQHQHYASYAQKQKNKQKNPKEDKHRQKQQDIKKRQVQKQRKKATQQRQKQLILKQREKALQGEQIEIRQGKPKLEINSEESNTNKDTNQFKEGNQPQIKAVQQQPKENSRTKNLVNLSKRSNISV